MSSVAQGVQQRYEDWSVAHKVREPLSIIPQQKISQAAKTVCSSIISRTVNLDLFHPSFGRRYSRDLIARDSHCCLFPGSKRVQVMFSFLPATRDTFSVVAVRKKWGMQTPINPNSKLNPGMGHCKSIPCAFSCCNRGQTSHWPLHNVNG